jgi:hypothetical protein
MRKPGTLEIVFKVVEKRAFGDAGLLAEVIHGR